MYISLLPKQQLRYVAKLLRKQQLVQIRISTLSSFHIFFKGTAQEITTQNRKCLQRKHSSGNFDNFTNLSAEKSEKAATITAILVENDEVAGESGHFSLKHLLYSETDKLMVELNKSQNYKQLWNIIKCHEGQFQREHLVQSIILLWNFCRQLEDGLRHDALAEPTMEKLLENLLDNLSNFNLAELSCLYLYLRKMGLPNEHVLLQNILLKALQEIETAKTILPLSAMSRLLVGINTDSEFHSPTVCRNFIPHILTHIATCTTHDEARLLAICLNNLQPLIDLRTLEDFKLRIRKLLDTDVINAQTPKTVLKLLHMLNMPEWNSLNVPLMRDLMLLLHDSMTQLNAFELKMICRIFQYILEPAALAKPLKRVTELRLRENATPETLSCYVSFVEPLQREPVIRLFKRLLNNAQHWHSRSASADFFNTLRTLKISEKNTCDNYWKHAIAELDDCAAEQLESRFLRNCHRYMNFNNNLGGTYRNQDFERRLCQMAMHAIENDVAGRIPNKFSRLAAFVFAYGHTPYAWKKFPNMLLSKIISMSGQFSISDCFTISRGMQIALDLRFRHYTPPILGMQFATIDSILLACIERHLNNTSALMLSDVNLIVRTLGHRKYLRNSLVYQEAFNKYKEANCNDLNSRTIRDMAYNFTATNFLEPDILETMFNYVEKNHKHVTGDTVEKILTCAYNLGYTPKSQDVIEYAAQILLRDFDYMSGLAIVQACLALCFHKTIPEKLINKVFCVDFIQRIEDEIQTCYSKATYPERVLNLVMQLNRTVCLDFPEANVPWFQQNFVEAQLSKKSIAPSQFNADIKQLLQVLLKEETYFRCNHTTPYGYQIDFVIHFDKDQRPMPVPAETTMLDRITKVAILLLKLDSFCENDLTTLRGPETLKMKHLEMMGYKVVHISEHDWNSKYMNAPGAKANYLKCLLKISN